MNESEILTLKLFYILFLDHGFNYKLMLDVSFFLSHKAFFILTIKMKKNSILFNYEGVIRKEYEVNYLTTTNSEGALVKW